MRVVMLVGAVVFCGVAAAQGPPIRMGLWENTTVTTTTLPPPSAHGTKPSGPPSTVPAVTKRRNCVNAESWQKALGLLNKPQKGCSMTNNVKNSRGASMTMSCAMSNGLSMVMQSTTSFDGAESMHGTLHTVTRYPPGTLGGAESVSDIKVTSRFVGAHCGSLAAGSGVDVK